jgi:hypothetical protein
MPSRGSLKTRAASGVAHLDELLAEAELRTPERDLVYILDIGADTAFSVLAIRQADHRRDHLCRWRLQHSRARMDGRRAISRPESSFALRRCDRPML